MWTDVELLVLFLLLILMQHLECPSLTISYVDMTRRSVAFVLGWIVLVAVAHGVVAGEIARKSWEEMFRSLPDPARMRATMELLAARPHHISSPYGKRNVDWMVARFKEWGWDVQVESFDVLFPTPKERMLEMIEPRPFTASLREPALPEDATSSQQDEQLPTYNAFSVDGDVTAPLVYVNYGIPEDYEQLERLGISVKGCIVIARYGASWRGIKPKVAAEHGAVGCLIYSDPKGDGYYQGDVFPNGPYRPSFGVQRGSVMDMPIHSGDPLTPGIAATPDAKRLALSEVETFTKIPTLPISYADAKPLLEALEGPVAPDQWRGALPITYKIGPGPTKVRLKLAFTWDMVKIHNVVARLKGSRFPDEWIVRGNHHDAWVNGAEDPISGLVAMLEEARALGVLVQKGWKPKRTIIYCAWDGEEQGLFGSTEWVEAHADELRTKAVLYINSDSNGRGYLQVGGSHSLERFINDVAKDVTDPETRLSVWKRLQMLRIKNATSVEARNELRSTSTLRIDALGSGSDYTPFLEHLGIASLHLGFGGEDGGGIYHSIYDDVYWYTHFSDTNFVYGKALAQTAGSAVVRAADAEVLPFEFTRQAATFSRYVDELKSLAKDLREEVLERHRQIDEGVFAATADPRKRFVPPPKEDVPPFLNFAPLENASSFLADAAVRYRNAQGRAATAQHAITSVNKKLIESERRLTHAAGLPTRPWFKHLIYAPGLYTGYGVKTLPGVREAIEQKKWKEAEQEILRAAEVIRNEADVILSAAEELERAAENNVARQKLHAD